MILNTGLNMADVLKSLLYTLLSAFVAVLSSITPALIGLGALWVGNFAMGYMVDFHVNKKPFSIQKAFDSITQGILIGMFMFLVYLIPFLQKDISLGENGIKSISYVVMYFYITNMSKNATLKWPESKFWAFLHDLLSTQMFANIKHMIIPKK